MACLRGVLVRHELLDLTRPKYNDRFEALQQVLVLDGRVDITQVFVGDVEVLHTLGNVAGLSDDSHEVVKVENEFFLHILRPISLTEELGAGIVHHSEELVQRITGANTPDYDVLDVLHCNALIELALDKVGHLIVLDHNFGIYFQQKLN